MDKLALTPDEIRKMRSVDGKAFNGKLEDLYFVVNEEDIRCYSIDLKEWFQQDADRYWGWFDSEMMMCLMPVLTPEEAIDIIYNGKEYVL